MVHSEKNYLIDMKVFAFLVMNLIIVSSSCAQNDPSTISAASLKRQIEAGLDGVLLDVRTPGEVAKGTLPGAVIIDFRSEDFRKELKKLDKGETYFVYCHAGGRSAKTQQMMEDLGFNSVIEYSGGFGEWSQLGYPLEKKN